MGIMSHIKMIKRGADTVQPPPKWLGPVLLFLLGLVCGIAMCLLTGCISEEEIQRVAKVARETPITVHVKVIDPASVSDQDELLLLLTEYNPITSMRAVPGLIKVFEHVAHVPYQEVIQRNLGASGITYHRFRWGDLNGDGVVDGKDKSACSLAGGRMW